MRHFILFLFLTSISYCQTVGKRVGGPFEDNDLIYEGMPKVINEVDTSFAWQASQKKLMIYGVIYLPDGKTPAAGIILYYYHTNEKGFYAPAPERASGDRSQTNAKKHGALRGWVKTNSKGAYKIYTIQPAAYPNRNIAAHVHMTIKEPTLNEYYIDDLEFDDDPLLTTAIRNKAANRGGSGVMITGEKNGVMSAERNITLGLNIPDYPVDKSKTLASGLSVGENCPAFDPIHFSGSDKGTKRCPMCSYGSGQGIMIWWNDRNTATLAAQLKKLDPLIDKYGVKKLRVFALYMNPERKSQKAVTKEMTLLVDHAKLKNVALLYAPIPADLEIFKLYQINQQVKNTILIYRKRKVVDKFINFRSNDIKSLLTSLEL
ncbi:hypothetical protein BH09BAC3_BH09BAC3_17710 [soil metagenome]